MMVMMTVVMMMVMIVMMMLLMIGNIKHQTNCTNLNRREHRQSIMHVRDH
jgi:uncharacterized membrane protein